MLNQVAIVGRLVRSPTLQESENGRKLSHITLAIPRSFRNLEGEYDTDFIDCTLFEGVAQNVVTYCTKGDIIAIKGRLQSRIVTKEDEKRYYMDLVAEKVTFLSSKKEKTE